MSEGRVPSIPMRLALCALCFTFASSAWALETPRVHGALGVAHAVGTPQQSEFGFGGQAAIALELPLAKPYQSRTGQDLSEAW